MARILKTEIDYKKERFVIIGKIEIPFEIRTFIELSEPIEYSHDGKTCTEVCVRTGVNYGQVSRNSTYGRSGETLVFPAKRKRIIRLYEIAAIPSVNNCETLIELFKNHEAVCSKILNKY